MLSEDGTAVVQAQKMRSSDKGSVAAAHFVISQKP